MRKSWKIPVIGMLVLLLVLVRLFEHELFYDPFMLFYQQGFSAVPEAYPAELFFNVVVRYVINALISLAILYVVFESRSILRFSALLYVVVFLLLFPLFMYLVPHMQEDDFLAAFYVRRFLVHPILILILLPAFYYQRLKERSVK